MAKFRLFNKTVLYNSKILGDIIQFCNNKLFKSGDALSTVAIIKTKISTYIEARVGYIFITVDHIEKIPMHANLY